VGHVCLTTHSFLLPCSLALSSRPRFRTLILAFENKIEKKKLRLAERIWGRKERREKQRVQRPDRKKEGQGIEVIGKDN
jgi:hypothetical protein